MLTLEGVSYRYAGAPVAAIRDIDLKLGDGEVVGVAGPNESGKTTLCLVVSGLAPRSIGGTLSGRLLVDGEDARVWPMHEFATRVGIAFQNPATQLTGVAGTVFEEVAFGPSNLGIPRDELLRRTEAALATLGIGDLAGRDPARLSGGQQQLVAIAGLLAMRPRHLVLDEPTAQLDPAGTRLVADAIGHLADEGFTILITEQKTDVLSAVCRRVVLVGDGRVAFAGPTSEVLADPRLGDLGIPAPAAVRVRRAAQAAGLPPAELRRLNQALSAGTTRR